MYTHTHIENLQKIFTSIIQTMEFGQKKYYTVIYDEKMVSGIKGMGRDWSWWGCPSKKKAAFFCSVKMVIEQGGGKRKCSRSFFVFFWFYPLLNIFILEIKCLESREQKSNELEQGEEKKMFKFLFFLLSLVKHF